MSDFRGIASALTIGVLVACVPAVACADDAPALAMPGLTVEIGLGVEYLQLPEINGFATVINDNPFNFVRQSDPRVAVEDLAPSGRLKVSVPLGAGWPFSAGWRLNGEISGASFSQSVFQRQVTGADDYLDVLPIDGSPSVGAVAAEGEVADLKAKGSFGYVMGALTAQSPWFKLLFSRASLEAGVSGMGSDGAWSAGYVDTATGASIYSLRETVESRHGGLVAVLNTSTGLGPNLRLVGRSRIHGLWGQSELHAHQFAANLDLAVRDKDETFSVRYDGRTGLEFFTDRIAIGVFATSSWQNGVAKIVNPRSGPGIVADAVTFAPPHLETGTATSIGVELRGTIKLD